MPHPLELIVSYAACQAPACQTALQGLALPHLNKLLARLSPTPEQPLAHTNEASNNLSLPHERAYAQTLGLPDANGHIPWGAWLAHQQGRAVDTDTTHPTDATATATAWAIITPCHWQVGTDHITLHDPAQLQLTPEDAQTLLEIVAPWLVEDGLTLLQDTPTRWLARGPLLADLPMPSLERVQGQDLRQWMKQPAPNQHIAPTQRRAMQMWQRLHSELQMLLYTHPFNDARQARGLPPVSAFWLHGAGQLAATPAAITPPTQRINTLQAPAQIGHWAAWASAWQALDAGPMAQLLKHINTGGEARLTLCGEQAALRWHTAPRSWGARLSGFFRPPTFTSVSPFL